MKFIAACLLTISILSISPLAIAQQHATQEQINQILAYEQWDQIKLALHEQNLPNLKTSTESYLLHELNLNPQDLSANQQILIQQISDLIINEMVNNIDTTKLLKDLHQAYQHLSDEEAAALINMYQQPALKNSGGKFPKMTAQILDLSSNEYDKIIQLDEIKKIFQEHSKP